MKASEIVLRARSLADIPHSNFISHDDEMQSLAEGYKDIYSSITDSSDDYFLSSIELDLSTVQKTALGKAEYEITLPADIYKLRFVDYMDSGAWRNMNRFNTNMRNAINTEPRYRWRGNKLWVLSSSLLGLPAKIRIDYYPAPVFPTVPEEPLEYGTAFAPYARSLFNYGQFFNIQSSNSDIPTDYFLYVSGQSIYLQSLALKTTVLLFTGTAIAGVCYYAGYIYFLDSGNIRRAPTDFISTLVPSMIVTDGTILNFSISENLLYYSTASNTYRATASGATPAIIHAFKTLNCGTVNSIEFYLKDSDGLVYIAGVSGPAALALAIGDDKAYYLDSLGDLYEYGTIPRHVAEKILEISNPLDGFIGTKSKGYNLVALSLVEDTELDYPLNEAWELLAYQSAIDYKRKQSGDPTLLMARAAEIRARFEKVLKRDEGQPERRISDTYSGGIW